MVIQVEKIMAEHELHQRAEHEEQYSYGSAFCNGQYVPIQEASVPLMDAGFLHADAAYDVVTVSRGAFFRLDDHLDRMEASCQKFFLENPYSREEVREILTNLVKLTGLKDAYVWWAVTRGPLSSASRKNPVLQQNAMFAFVSPYFFQADDERRTNGLEILISKHYNRISEKAVDPTAKNFHWMDMKLGLYEARSQDKDWVVLTDGNGYLTEAAGANIFAIKNNEIYTPDSGCLEGITRRTVIELANELGVKTHITKVKEDELLEADEAFTSSSAGGVMPIQTVDEVVLPIAPTNENSLAAKLHDLYWTKRWDGWLATKINYDS
ncbi:Branched-chain amino acid aminotransferase [Acinetobacter lactucae]|uniref:branched-chain-amino-acid transaminase n=2 Tax=Acinetobacter TaxID=469 RepID=A0ABS1ALK0_9GAMM|nr:MULTISPECIES: aminotransferase class IV [Acinetobacter calcoaceticus/baumannii complex]ARD28777.1 branched-chain amino acid--2-keto-4-methylthiobutyrate aminotransferase [Acinetobacter lactucae]KYQ81510.1 Branched-chain amino acid aminotransferase [Acinetobacter lactucae]MBJ8438786.1 aminotransferase class IV [Acinetobacter lactucae]MCU4349081.1 aminotransferase class IV [Acinetobacter lactucae]QWZ59189.1 aminotransferase class IV [Acinetobacter pittii]